MKISRVDVTVLNVPFVAPLRWAGGVEDGWSRCIVEVHTDDGLTGLGVTLDRERFALYAEAHRREGDISIYAEDEAGSGMPPVKSRW